LFERVIAPINRVAAQGAGIFYHVHKELLRKRGVIRTAVVRSPAPLVDELTQRELEQIIAALYGDGGAP
jgi:4-hydroxy-tetrahydrodipicolinate synthase